MSNFRNVIETMADVINIPNKITGMKGEVTVSAYLKMNFKDANIFHDIYVPIGDKAVQIDTVMVDKSGIYVFEVKNYEAWIFGNDKNEKWTSVYVGGRKNQFYNPTKQNKTHIVALTKYTKLPQNYFYNIVCFTNSKCELKKVTSVTPVIHIRDLSSTIKNIKSANQNILNDNDILMLNNKLSIKKDELKKKHKDTIRQYRKSTKVADEFENFLDKLGLMNKGK